MDVHSDIGSDGNKKLVRNALLLSSRHSLPFPLLAGTLGIRRSARSYGWCIYTIIGHFVVESHRRPSCLPYGRTVLLFKTFALPFERKFVLLNSWLLQREAAISSIT